MSLLSTGLFWKVGAIVWMVGALWAVVVVCRSFRRGHAQSPERWIWILASGFAIMVLGKVWNLEILWPLDGFEQRVMATFGLAWLSRVWSDFGNSAQKRARLLKGVLLLMLAWTVYDVVGLILVWRQ